MVFYDQTPNHRIDDEFYKNDTFNEEEESKAKFALRKCLSCLSSCFSRTSRKKNYENDDEFEEHNNPARFRDNDHVFMTSYYL